MYIKMRDNLPIHLRHTLKEQLVEGKNIDVNEHERLYIHLYI